MELNALFDVLVKHRDVRLVFGGDYHFPDLLAPGQKHLLFDSMGSEDLSVKGQFSGHRDALLHFSLQR